MLPGLDGPLHDRSLSSSNLAEIGSFFRPPYVAASILSGLAEIGGFFRPPRLNGHYMSFIITIHVVNILNDQTI